MSPVYSSMRSVSIHLHNGTEHSPLICAGSVIGDSLVSGDGSGAGDGTYVEDGLYSGDVETPRGPEYDGGVGFAGYIGPTGLAASSATFRFDSSMLRSCSRSSSCHFFSAALKFTSHAQIAFCCS
jgi:hypothetical protein